MALFLLLWVGLGSLLGWLLTSAAGGVVVGAGTFGALALACVLYACFFGKATVLSVAGAKPADSREHAELFHTVRTIVGRAGLPMPDLYIIDDPSPNACATGRDARHAALAVTSGLLQSFRADEVEGVVAHELAHIRNRDVLLLLITSTAIGLAALLANWGAHVLEMMLIRSSEDDKEDSRFAIILVIAEVLLAMVALIIGPLIQLALSRTRENLADVQGARFAGSPNGLLSALQRLEQSETPLRRSNPATAALYIDNPLEHHQRWFNGLFDSHPPIEERIQALQLMASLPATAVAEHRQREAARAQAEREQTDLPDWLAAVLLVGSFPFWGGVLLLWILNPDLHLWAILAAVLLVVSGGLTLWLSSSISHDWVHGGVMVLSLLIPVAATIVAYQRGNALVLLGSMLVPLACGALRLAFRR